MNIYVYADESGVLDPVHNDYYVFGGLILLGKEEKDRECNKYLSVERSLSSSDGHIAEMGEMKACRLSNKSKSKIFRSLNGVHKFGVIIEQGRLYDYVWKPKKTRQRYLDFVFKVALKRALQGLMNDGFLNASEVDGMYVFVDEHTTATDGRYELQESLETEFKYGTTNFDFMTHFPPLFPGMRSVSVQMKDSRSSTLIRAADIVANRIYHCACVGDYSGIDGKVRYIIQP